MLLEEIIRVQSDFVKSGTRDGMEGLVVADMALLVGVGGLTTAGI